MNAQLTIINEWQTIINLVVDSVTSAHSKRAYQRALNEFMAWYRVQGSGGFNKGTVNAYRDHLIQSGKSRSSINQALAAIRKLAAEASDNGLIPAALAYGIERVKNVKQTGIHSGNWLTQDEAQALVNAPTAGGDNSLKALRDRAILAVMIGTALRRSEVVALTWEHIQQREGRWAIIDMLGKGSRVRTIGMPAWVKAALDAWAEAAGFSTGAVFCPINKGGRITGQEMTPQAIYNLVAAYGLAAHDLRRTSASLALKGGADMRQIQHMLGHASITTTERYLQPIRSLQTAAGDFIQLDLVSH